MKIVFILNGQEVQVEAEPLQPLDQILRNVLHVESVASGCGAGDCGICAISFEGCVVAACMTPAMCAVGAEIWTVEGLGDHPNPKAASILRAKDALEKAVCGACLPAQAMTALTEDLKLESFVDVLCRCGTWHDLLQHLHDTNGDSR